MKVIYHDRTGRHLSVVAASLHLQLINKNVSREELLQLPYFLNKKPPGTLLYMGLDSEGKEVYTLGRKGSFKVIRNAYLGMNRIFKLNHELVFIDINPLSNWKTKIFDLCNRHYDKEVKCGHLLLKGMEQAIPKVALFVEDVRKMN